MAHYIGIDLGTSSCKLLLTDEKGSVLREASRQYRLLQPKEGWKEIEASTWWQAVREALLQLLENTDPSQVKGIGITGQMHSLVLLDENGRPVRPVLMWNDVRTQSLIPALKAQIAHTSVFHINSIISTGSPAANLYWVKENEPENFKKIRHFLIGPDYLVYKFTGVYGTDFCEASTSSMYDLIKREWSPEMMRILQVKPDIFPQVRGSAQVVGTVLPEITAAFGLRPDTTVIAGTGDNPAASLPTGCLANGYPVLSLGTSGVLVFPRERPDFVSKGKNILFSFDGKECFTLTQGVVQSCGSGYSWLLRDIFGKEDYAAADRLIDPGHLGENALLFYPHLTGDKTIYQDPSLRGAFLGLGTDTTRMQMVQAFMEGIAYAVRQLIEEMGLQSEKVGQLRVIGGGSRSRIWMQIFADVLNIEILQLQGNAGAGYGMALLAAYACGELSSLSEISKKAVSVKEAFQPDKRSVTLYEEGYGRYLKVHDFMKEIFL